MPWQAIPLEESLPSCERGDLFRVNEVKLLEKQTSPPDYLTEAELITLMEKHGIGREPSFPAARLAQGGAKEVLIFLQRRAISCFFQGLRSVRSW